MRIRYYIRVRQNFRVRNSMAYAPSRAWWLFHDLKVEPEKFYRMALVWAYLVRDHKDMNVKPIRILKNGRRAISIVKYGLEEIADILIRPDLPLKSIS